MSPKMDIPLKQLRPGDRTPWYEVVGQPERTDDGEYRVLVRHFPYHGRGRDHSFTDYVKGPGDTEVPATRRGDR